MNPGPHDLTSGDDDLRLAFRTLVDATPPTPSYDQMIDIAARNGLRAPEWATDRYALPDAVGVRARPRRRAGGIIAAWLLTIGVVGGGGYAAYAAFVGPDGYDTPTAAVDGFLGALEEGNLLKASRALVPWERTDVEAMLPGLLTTAQNDGLLTTNDVQTAKNISLRREGLGLTEVPMASGFTRVEARSGKLELTVDSALFGANVGLEPGVKTYDLVDLLGRTLDDGTGARHPNPALVAVQDNGDWYVSLSYTIAEYARSSNGAPVPDLSTPVQPRGADTPEGAANGASELAFGNDRTQRVLDVIDPVSGGAVLRYLPKPTEVAPDPAPSTSGSTGTTSEPFTASWRIDGTGDTRTAYLTGLKIFGTAQTYTPDKRCYDYEGTCIPFFGSYLFDDGLEVVKRDGRWYADPISGAMRLYLGLIGGRANPLLHASDSSGSNGSDAHAAEKLDPLVGTPGLPPEATRVGGDGTWSVMVQAGTPPSPQLSTMLADCLSDPSSAIEEQRTNNRPEGAGPEFPAGFFACLGREFGGYGMTSSGTTVSIPAPALSIPAQSIPVPTSTP